MSRRAFSYVRFSTRGQISGDSLSRQLSRARDYAARHKLQLDESSYQDLGISAFRSRNATDGALKSFLDAVDDGTIPSDVTLLVENFDRLSRAHVSEALDLFMSITKRGVTIVTLIDEQVYNRKTINENWTKLIISLAMMARAHEESATKSMRTRSGKLAALERGLKIGKAPFWMQLETDKRTFTIDEVKADIVRSAFDMRLDDIGSLRIARHLNETYGFKWGSPQVARLLQNPAVVGTRMSQAGHAPLIDYYPPIVSKHKFYAVQRLMSAHIGAKRGRRPEDEPNLFRGIARCAKCGGSMQFFREGPSVKQRYLKCRPALTAAGCDAGFVNYDAFEQEVIGSLLLDQDDELVPLFEKRPTTRVFSNVEVIALKEQQSRLIDLAASGVMNIKLVTEKMNALEMLIRQQEQHLAEIPADDSLFAEKAWLLVERHENAKLEDDKSALYAVRRELRTAFQRALARINVQPDRRIDDEHLCSFSVEFRGTDAVLSRQYTRPALNNIRGAMNGWAGH